MQALRSNTRTRIHMQPPDQGAAIPLAANLALKASMRTGAEGPEAGFKDCARFSHQVSRKEASKPTARAALVLALVAILEALAKAKGDTGAPCPRCFLRREGKMASRVPAREKTLTTFLTTLLFLPRSPARFFLNLTQAPGSPSTKCHQAWESHSQWG